MPRESEAETLFAGFLRRAESGEQVGFEAWVAAHPDLRSELEQLYRDWCMIGGVARVFESESFFFHGGERVRPQPAEGLAPGKVVGDFRLVELIGQGGMGQVWEAAQTSLGDRLVAIKFVRSDRVTPRQLELFQREARAGGRLSHPGIVAVYGYGQSDGLAWIAMELVDGCWTLRDFLDERIRQEELPPGYDREVARFVAETADALDAAHEAGVIHRDLKPQNILVTKEDRPKVTDFGLARITDESELSKTGDFAGTYFYMSPEQVAARRAGIDHRTDVFSLGAVLYELIALRRPFEGDTTHQVAAQILAKDPIDPRTIRSRIPKELVVIAGKALEKDREKRYASMGELADDLRRFMAGEPILAKPPNAWERAFKWVRRHRAVSVAIAAGVAALTFSILALAFYIEREDTSAVLSERERELLLDAIGRGEELTTDQRFRVVWSSGYFHRAMSRRSVVDADFGVETDPEIALFLQCLFRGGVRCSPVQAAGRTSAQLELMSSGFSSWLDEADLEVDAVPEIVGHEAPRWRSIHLANGWKGRDGSLGQIPLNFVIDEPGTYTLSVTLHVRLVRARNFGVSFTEVGIGEPIPWESIQPGPPEYLTGSVAVTLPTSKLVVVSGAIQPAVVEDDLLASRALSAIGFRWEEDCGCEGVTLPTADLPLALSIELEAGGQHYPLGVALVESDGKIHTDLAEPFQPDVGFVLTCPDDVRAVCIELVEGDPLRLALLEDGGLLHVKTTPEVASNLVPDAVPTHVLGVDGTVEIHPLR